MTLQELGSLLLRDPVQRKMLRTMGLLETAAHRFGVVQAELYKSGRSNKQDVQKAIRAHVMVGDSTHNLTLVQRDRLFTVAHDAAGVEQFED